MKIYQLLDANYIIQDILNLEEYPDIFERIKEDGGFNKPGRGGRRMCRMTDPGLKYTIFGKSYPRKNWSSLVIQIRNEIEKKLNFNQGYFNTCTINWYGTGRSSFRLHTDEMPELEDPMIVATLTLGDSNRSMSIVNINTGRGVQVKLPHNSLFVMGPGMQQSYLHGIEPDPQCKHPRLSLSFRRQRV